MSRVEDLFERKKPFIAYLLAEGKETVEAALALEEGGVDILELGIPFSDPVADGPVIQKAHERAIKAGVTLDDVLDVAAMIRAKSDIPIILMGYYNPILNAGEDFFEQASQVGVDGLLIVDLPIEEAKPLKKRAQHAGLDTIFIVSQSTPEERIGEIDAIGSGFLYYACQKGTTGMRSNLPENYAEKVQSIKQRAELPVAVGFGIANRQTAQDVLKEADGFIVGSIFIKALQEGAQVETLKQLAQEIDPRRESHDLNSQ